MSLPAVDVHGQMKPAAIAATAAADLVRFANIEGRGRALVAFKALRAGEIVLKDSPILLYSALPILNPSLPQLYCSNCYRILESSSIVSCSSSCSALFCSPNCRSAAAAASHTPWVCQSIYRLRDYCSSSSSSPPFHSERQVQARFLVAAYNLALVSPSDFRILLCLQGESQSPPQPNDAGFFLHSLLSSLCPPPLSSADDFSFSLELTAALLAKDKLNAFGLMEPFAEDRERTVRAYGIYPKASFFNHDCLPNACRFDYVDASASAVECNTDIVVRMIHDVPEGREICLSYFPVNLSYSDRQRRLREDYGFTCACDRCKVEANWSDKEEEDDDAEEEGFNGEEAMDEDHDEIMEDSETEDGGIKDENNFPHAYFFLRYMCNRNNCWGTLAPVPPSNGTASSTMECNVCGNLKHDDAAMDGDALEE